MIDQRTDIWAFGVVFYEMLAGRGAFERETVADTIAAVLGAEIDWSLLPLGTPPKVRRLLQRCLERDVKRRLRDIGDAWIEFDAPDEAEASALPRGRVTAAILSAALAIGMGAGWLIRRAGPRPTEPVARWSEAIAADQLELSEDGSRLLYGDDSIARSYLRLLDRFDSQRIAGFTRGFATFSPDGRWLAVATETGLQKLPATGGTPVTLSGEVGTSQPSWGDDGAIVFSTRRGLMRISDQGGAAQVLTTVDPGKGETAHVFPHLLPGSREVLFTVRTGIRNEDTRVAVLDLRSGSWRTIRENAFDARYVPTGHLLYLHGGSLIAAPFDLKRMEVTGGEAPVVDGLPQDSFESRYSVSSTGVLAYLSGDVATEGSINEVAAGTELGARTERS